MEDLFTIALFFSAIRLATPLIFAALGGLFSERSGIINIALEGLMLAGAFTAAVVTFELNNPYIGLLAGMIAGGLLALVYAVAVIQFEADQVVAGVAINFLMLGVPHLLSGAIYDSSGSTPQIDKEFLLPDVLTFIDRLGWYLPIAVVALIYFPLQRIIYDWLSRRQKASGGNMDAWIARGSAAIIVLGSILLVIGFLGTISISSLLAFLLVPVCWYILYKTPFGLRLRATGENPEAADVAGVPVLRLRYTAVVISGLLAAAGGAYLSIGQSSLFTRAMTAGRGFIALAALILAKWRPVPVMIACLFFGFMEALTIQIQGVIKLPSGEDIPVQFIQIIPYVLTMIVLAGFIGLSRAPKALGIPYRKEN